jgi:hypothetical protein
VDAGDEIGGQEDRHGVHDQTDHEPQHLCSLRLPDRKQLPCPTVEQECP